jgi:hypothetical protein
MAEPTIVGRPGPMRRLVELGRIKEWDAKWLIEANDPKHDKPGSGQAHYMQRVVGLRDALRYHTQQARDCATMSALEEALPAAVAQLVVEYNFSFMALHHWCERWKQAELGRTVDQRQRQLDELLRRQQYGNSRGLADRHRAIERMRGSLASAVAELAAHKRTLPRQPWLPEPCAPHGSMVGPRRTFFTQDRSTLRTVTTHPG